MESPYRPAWWLPGPHSMTLWGKFFHARLRQHTREERWPTTDGDTVTVVRRDAGYSSPRIVLLHGLEGSRGSHYVSGVFDEARRRQWGVDLLLFRTCDGRLNSVPRSYHSGETTDLDLVVSRVRNEFPDSPLAIVGVSLGANVALKWLGEHGEEVPAQIRCAIAVSTPFDLSASSNRIGQGGSRIYQWNFLRSLRRKALRKLDRFPEIASRRDVMSARTLREFDDAFTAPVHGFQSVAAYYEQCSSLRYLHAIRVPTLLLSARDDPFHTEDVLRVVEQVARENPSLQPEFHERGGHVGFVEGGPLGRVRYYAERRIGSYCSEWFAASGA